MYKVIKLCFEKGFISFLNNIGTDWNVHLNSFFFSSYNLIHVKAEIYKKTRTSTSFSLLWMLRQILTMFGCSFIETFQSILLSFGLGLSIISGTQCCFRNVKLILATP